MRTVNRSSTLTALNVALSLLWIGCGDDADSSDTNITGPDGGLDAGIDSSTLNLADGSADGGTSRPTTESPLYALVSIPATSMGAPTTSYVIVTDRLSGELKTESAALQVPGNAIAAGPAGGKRLFVGVSMGGLLTRYDLASNGTLVKSGEVNFEAKQVPNFIGYAAAFQFIDAHKAYYFSLTAAKIVVWDPEAMTISGEIALPQVVRANPDNPGTNYTSSLTGAPIRRGDKLYFFVSWDSRTAGTIKIIGAAAVIVVDTKTDSATVVIDEQSCGARDGVISGDWLYLATEGASASAYYLNNANAQPPCLRRFDLKSNQFDPAYKPDLSSVAGGPAGSLVVSPDGTALIYVLDKVAADPMIGPEQGKINNPRVLAVGALWKTGRLTVGDTPKVDLLNLPLTSGSVLPQTLKDGFKVTATFDSQPQLREVTDDGVVATERANGKLYGNTASIVQLR
jgi:hypothetical protein